jgi:hypothetical protein
VTGHSAIRLNNVFEGSCYAAFHNAIFYP